MISEESMNQILSELNNLKNIDYSKSENQILEEKNLILVRIIKLLSQIQSLSIDEQKQITEAINNIRISNLRESIFESIETIGFILSVHFNKAIAKLKLEEKKEVEKGKIDRLSDELQSLTDANYVNKITAKRGRLIREIQREIAKIKRNGENDEKTLEVLEQLETRLQTEIENHKNQLNERYSKEFSEKEATVPAILTVLPVGVALQATKIEACIREMMAAKTNKQRIFAAVNIAKALGMTVATPVIFTVKFIIKHWYLIVLLLSLIKFPKFDSNKKDDNDDEHDYEPEPSKVPQLEQETATELQPKQETSTALNHQHNPVRVEHNQDTATELQPKQETSTALNHQHNPVRVEHNQDTATELQPKQETSTELNHQQDVIQAHQNRQETATQLQPKQETSTILQNQPEIATTVTEPVQSTNYTDAERNVVYALAKAYKSAYNHSIQDDKLIFNSYEDAVNYIKENYDLESIATMYGEEVKDGNYDHVIDLYLTKCDPITFNLHSIEWLVGKNGLYSTEEELFEAALNNSLIGAGSIYGPNIREFLSANPDVVNKIAAGDLTELENYVANLITPLDLGMAVLTGFSAPAVSQGVESSAEIASDVIESLGTQGIIPALIGSSQVVR